jgi:hypothetical protein
MLQTREILYKDRAIGLPCGNQQTLNDLRMLFMGIPLKGRKEQEIYESNEMEGKSEVRDLP